MAFQFLPFVITPSELEQVLEPFTLFVGNAHVPAEYRFTPVSDYIGCCTALYSMLCAGDRPDFRRNGELMKYYCITTDIGSVMFGNPHEYEGERYKTYIGSIRGDAPYLAPFSFSVFFENGRLTVSTRGSVFIGGAEIMGYQLVFSKDAEEDDSAEDFGLFRKRLAKLTGPLRFTMDGIEKKTAIRVSNAAKESLRGFYCINSRNIEIL